MEFLKKKKKTFHRGAATKGAGKINLQEGRLKKNREMKNTGKDRKIFKWQASYLTPVLSLNVK